MKVLEGDRPYLTPMKEKLAEYPADCGCGRHNGTYRDYRVIQFNAIMVWHPAKTVVKSQDCHTIIALNAYCFLFN